MVKTAVRHGDPTSTGGVVMAFFSTMYDDGKRVALTGDDVTCGNCEGIFKVYGTGQGMSESGRAVVLDGDLASCPCGKNRVITGDNPGIYLESSGNYAGEKRQIAQASETVGYFSQPGVWDEQVRASRRGVVLEGIPYFIQTSSGETIGGRTDAEGLLPRVTGDGEYVVYWNDEALAKYAGT